MPNELTIRLCAIIATLATADCSQTTSPPAGGGPTVEERVSAILSQMTLDEKIGQMTQVDRSSLASEDDITSFALGSLLSGGGSSPVDNSPQGWADMYDAYQAKALASRLGIPLLYGVDAVHGHNNVRGAVIFPHNIGMGSTWNRELVEEAARVTAREVAATGIDWTFSPCIAVPRDERWGRTYEGFGETPELSAMMADAAVRGYQGALDGSRESILACAKHFAGDGGTTGGVDQGNTEVDEQTLRAIHIEGYRSAVRAGVGSIMVSFSSWNGVKMHAQYYLLTVVLKGELGFDGFLVSDWGAIDQLPGDYTTDVATAINAGLDMIMVPSRYQEFISTLRSLALQGRVPMERIDDAVRRILRIKVRMGLFEHPYTDKTLISSVGSAAHREVARECVRQSVVLLKNEGGLLPLPRKTARIHVAGKSADDLGIQCGGWTISWQGSPGPITEGTTILQAIRNAVDSTTSITYSRDGLDAAGADFGIVVVGETPYAEGAGDRQDLALANEDILAVARVKGQGVPTLVILVSGRPMIIESALGAADAFLAAWLPGTEGQGIADVLFGDYHPTGKLPHSWPRRMTQIPINTGDATYDPLFPYGFGLTY